MLNCVLRQHVWSSEAWSLLKLASLILVVNVVNVGELRRKRTLAASRGFLAAARLSCSSYTSTASLYVIRHGAHTSKLFRGFRGRPNGHLRIVCIGIFRHG